MTTYESKFWTKNYDDHVTKKNLKIPNKSLGKIFDVAMQRFPNKPACWFMKREMPYSELRDYVHRFATFLQENGLEKGDRVAINLPNCPQYLIANYGTILAGGVASGCSPLLSEDEIAYQINDSKAKFIVTLDAVYAKILKKEGVLDKVPNLETVITTNVSEFMGLSSIMVFLGKLLGKIPKGKVSPYPGKNIVKFQDVLNTEINLKEVEVDPKKDLVLLQYTGGTTGRPKGTQITHYNETANILQVADWLNLEIGEDLDLSAFPYFHIAGLFFNHCALYHSDPQVCIADPRDTNHIIKEIIDKRPTMIANVPSLYLMIMNNPKVKTIPDDVLEHVNVFITAAAPFPSESIREFESVMNAENKVMEVYGMTEASPLLTMNPYLGEKKVGWVGLPLQDTEIRLVNIETGEDAPLGESGEIIAKGPQVTPGYLNKPEANKKTIIDGWFHTGDVGIMDEKGYIKLVDRVKDMINVSGFKVYSVHVEEVMTKQQDIEIIALIGVKDEKRPGSEIVKAFITLKEGLEPTEEVKERIKQYAKDNLAKYEIPKLWEFKKELPLTTVGKVLKRELRNE
ncbi:MAG: AMP-dependent synthetase [Promethearchaeota archaeon]|nr:MAG: AMP-dependent synthetase [Candidatus Lokiarchaeota archaeon]